MSLTTLRRLIDRFYPRPTNGFKIPLLGIDGSGKTTILYRLKTGEIVVTIPTIGFNVEKITVRAGQGRVITMLCWDAGGCTKFTPSFYRPYTSGSDALIWVVDGCDRERIYESVEELGKHIHMMMSDPSNPDLSPKDLPVLIIATKQDLPNAIPLEELRFKFARATTNSHFYIVGTSRTQGTAEEEAFGWLLTEIEAIRARKPSVSAPAPEVPNPQSAAALESKLDEWLVRSENESSPDQFLQQFESLSLPAWDHYTHIRIAYLLLTIYGRQKGKNLIFEGLEKYIAQSEQTRGRTFHVTMTYFWIQMVHFGISSMPPTLVFDRTSISDKFSLQTLVEDEKSGDKQTPREGEKPNDYFTRFLLINPHLADGNLWAQYYSKEVIMSPKAKAEMVFPDKKPLPNLVSRETVSSPNTRLQGSE